MKLLVAMFPVLLFGQQITFTGTPKAAGQQVTVNVNAVAFTGKGIPSLQFSMALPTGVASAIPTVAAGITAINKALFCNSAGAVPFLICVVTTGPNAATGGTNEIPDGLLASITMSVPAAGGSVVPTATEGATLTGNLAPVIAGPAFNLLLSPCDINGDGVVDNLDIRHVIDEIDKAITPATTDLNNDGKTDVVDLQRVVNAVATGVCKTGP